MKKFLLFLVFSSLFLSLGVYTARFLPHIKQVSSHLPSLDFGLKPSPYPLQNRPFVLLLIGKNGGATIEKTLLSILCQKYDSFRMIYIDDASSDGSLQHAKHILSTKRPSFPVHIIENQTSEGWAANLFKALPFCEDDEIVVMMHTHDLLAHEWVLERLNQYFANPNLWFCCCQARQTPSFEKMAPPAPSKEQFLHFNKTSFDPFYLPAFVVKLLKNHSPQENFIPALLAQTQNHFQYIPETLCLTPQGEAL